MADVATEEQEESEVLQVPAPVANALTRFADVSRRLSILEAIGWSTALAIVLFTLIACADRWLMIGDGLRKAFATAAYSLALGLAAALLYRALRGRSASEIALALESRVPDNALQERVSTTVELAEERIGSASISDNEFGKRGISEALIERVADEAAQIIEGLDIEELPDRSRVQRAGKLTGIAFGVMVFLCIIPNLYMATFYVRAVLPWRNMGRPSNTTLTVLPGDTRVVEGALLEIETRLGGEIENEVFIEMREGEHGDWLTMPMDADAERRERFTLKVGPMRAPMSYRVRSGDGISAEYNVDVLPRPEIASLKITVTYPTYTKLPPAVFERINGDLSVLKGSKVTLSVEASTALSAAVLEFSDDRKLSMALASSDSKGSVAAASFDVNEDTQYRVQLRSTDGVSNPDAPLFSLRAIPDRAPQVSVIKPLSDEAADPASLLNLESRAEDDLGITSMRLIVRTDKRATPATIKLQRPPEASKVWMIAQPWDLAGLFLEDGETVVYRVEAIDTAGSIGRSDERRLRVASGQRRTSATLLAELEKVQKQLEGASRLLASVRRDVSDVRQLFRPEDIDFQAAERLLLSDAINRVARQTLTAAKLIEAASPNAEWAPLKSLLAALANALERYSSTELRPMLSSARRAHSNDPQAITAGLDVMLTQAPAIENRLRFLHQALTVAHRYTGAVRLEERATDVKEAQQKITPLLIGTAGWSPQGIYTPGLMGEYFRGVNFETLARRTVDTRVDIRNADVPDIGHENYSVRWKGQVLAPKTARYVFRVSADDGVRLTIAGKRLVDEWRMQTATAFEGAIELQQGWHDIMLEYYQGGGGSEIVLTRSGPRMPDGPIPPDHLRNLGAPAIDVNAHGLKDAMAKGASDTAVEQALVRQQTMVTVAQGIPPELIRLATLKPEIDADIQKEAAQWDKEVRKHTAEIRELKTLNAGLAVPLTRWRDETRNLAARCEQVRRRYAVEVEAWLKKLANDVFDSSAKLKQLQQSAEAAKKAFEELTQAAKQPKDEKRDTAMARADATVRAMADDLQKQADRVAKEFKAAAQDMQRPLEERRLLQALQHRAEDMAHGPAEALEKRLNEAKTPEALAQTETKVPNFATQASDLARQAAEAAQAAEKMERALALREALADAAKDDAKAQDLLNQPPTAETAAAQQRAAAELREDAAEIKAAMEAARPTLTPPTAGKAQQALDQAANNERIADMLEKSAAKTLSGEAKTPKPGSAEDKARQNAAQELAGDAQKARDAATAVNSELAAAAQQLNGDAAAKLREAARDTQQSADALNANDTQDALNNAGEKAESAAETAAQTAERLALDAEAARKAATNDAQRARADDMVRLAAAINNEVEKHLAPAADYLERAQQSAAANPPDAQNANPIPKPERQKRSEEARAEAAKLNKMAEIAAQLNTQDPNQQKAAHDALSKVLAEQGAAQAVEAALDQAEALDKIAADLQTPEKTPSNSAQPSAAQQPANGEQAGETPPSNETIESAEKALANLLGENSQQAAKAAMAERLNDLAQELREQAEADKQLASRIGQAGNLEQQARDNLKKEAPVLANALKSAQAGAATAAKETKAPESAQPLKNAEKALGEAASATQAAAKNADSAPLSELAKALDKIADQVEAPVGEIAAALPKSGNGQEAAQQAGQQARQAAGREAELADELQRAERAAEMAQADAQAASGDREALEAQVKAAIDALGEEGALPTGNAELAALAKAANAGGQDLEGGQQNGEKSPAGQQAEQQGAPSGQKGSPSGQQKKNGQKSSGKQGGKSGQAGQSAEPSLKDSFQEARAEAERMTEMAAQIEKIAAALNPDGQASLPAAARPDIATPAADALQALAAADAASETGAAAEAASQAQQAAELLSQAAEAARSQATGLETPGGEEAQAMSEGKSLGSQAQAKGQGKTPGKGTGQGKQGAMQATAAKSKGALAPEPPQGIPIDKATWNRLPDNLRRDLLNAAGGRFPAEYEASIKRYFKNVASTKEEKAQ